jgi:hypothetical protein
LYQLRLFYPNSLRVWYRAAAAKKLKDIDPLDKLSDRFGDADWLNGAFSAGDLMIAAVLLRLTSPMGKRDPPASGPSTLNWPCLSARQRPPDERYR